MSSLIKKKYWAVSFILTLYFPERNTVKAAAPVPMGNDNSTATVSTSKLSFVLSQTAADEVRDCHKM